MSGRMPYAGPVLVMALSLGGGLGHAQDRPAVQPSVPSVAPRGSALPPGAADEVSRLQRIAQALHEKASDLRMRIGELEDQSGPSDQTESLEEKADDYDYKAYRYEDDADEILRTGSGPKKLPWER